MTSQRRSGRVAALVYWLRPWPLLVSAVLAMAGAALLSTSDQARELIAAALVATSTVCIGAWIALLSNAGYTGHDQSIRRYEEGLDAPSEDKRAEPFDEDGED